jgi:phytoene desaturase
VNFNNSPVTYPLYKDLHKLAEQFNNIEPDFEIRMQKYLEKSKRIYHDTVVLVIKSNYESILHYLITLIRVKNPVYFPLLFRTFWQQVTAISILKKHGK